MASFDFVISSFGGYGRTVRQPNTAQGSERPEKEPVAPFQRRTGGSPGQGSLATGQEGRSCPRLGQGEALSPASGGNRDRVEVTRNRVAAAVMPPRQFKVRIMRPQPINSEVFPALSGKNIRLFDCNIFLLAAFGFVWDGLCDSPFLQ